jgi:hypothetical protein
MHTRTFTFVSALMAVTSSMFFAHLHNKVKCCCAGVKF